MGKGGRPGPPSALGAIAIYYRGLVHALGGGSLGSLRSAVQRGPIGTGLEPSPRAALHIYQLALAVRLWSQPHYRSGTFRQDLRKNLRNVAIPGTGVALSVLSLSRAVAVAFLLVAYPLIAAVAAVVRVRHGDAPDGWAAAFAEQLLEPDDWFFKWRLNCVLASYHALVTNEAGYAMEDKLTFLEAAEAAGVAASPWLKLPAKLIVKHRNEEGGLGIAVYSNACVGGDWIIQECLDNHADLAALLPGNAPLSTLRLVTASRACMREGAAAAASDISVLSCCWRAGRAGAATDHSSVLFDVDLASGEIGKGTSSAHWYQLGPAKAWRCARISTGHTETHHPDSGVKVTGASIPKMAEVRQLVVDAHLKMMPNVLLAGWDVAITPGGLYLLEANLSCNFFRASLDRQQYYSFVGEAIGWLERKTP